VLDLPRDANVLWESVLTSQNRNKIRKAEKHGVSVRRGRDRAVFAAYAELYRESVARWGAASTLPAALFAALVDAHPGIDVWLAEHEGRPIAALLNFTCGGQVMNWGNVSRREAWNLSPNNLLHWRALQAACGDFNGPRTYNFGSSAGLPGVETFKAAFGAREHAYLRCEAGPAWVRRLRRGS
jgi:lipid II:glycine glycyltransferase (peptidoglycan interpeptide bridge formation enzyme)